MSISAGIGFVPQAIKFGRDISGSQYARYTWARDGDFVYNKGNSLKFPQGCVYQLRGWGEVAAPNVFITFRLKRGIVAQFLQYCFEKNIHGIQLKKHITSGARSNGLLNLSKEQFFDVTIPTPKQDEQEKIAGCLNSLDEVIAAQRKKVEVLRIYKHGLMREIFPREGETSPNLRLPEFREAPEWKPTTLGALVDFHSGSTPSKANPAFWKGSIPWVSAKDMKKIFLDDAKDHISTEAITSGAKLVPSGSVLLLTRGMTLLRDVPICVLRREMSLNQDVKALLPKGDSDGLFVALLLISNKQRMSRMVDIAGHGTGRLDTDKLKALELSAPRPAEQQRIGIFITSLEERIAAEEDKLESLNALKKGLLQKLFPAPDES